MRENRPSGSEGGAGENPCSYPYRQGLVFCAQPWVTIVIFGVGTKKFKWACHWLGRQSYCSTNIEKFMADAANKYPENVPGKYYVDNQCIDCDLCRETAPDNFKRNEDGGYSYLSNQPESPEQEARCKEAKEGCPVEAIGDNGA
jgi:ferredoxin